ncbi:MAG: hypothetical protein ACKPKO_28065, partial [Candidatus Fonsibacter sp.]
YYAELLTVQKPGEVLMIGAFSKPKWKKQTQVFWQTKMIADKIAKYRATHSFTTFQCLVVLAQWTCC